MLDFCPVRTLMASAIAKKRRPAAKVSSKKASKMTTFFGRWPGDTQGAPKRIGARGLPHGTVLGTCHGVDGYNCNYRNMVDDDSDGSHYLNGLYTGAKWQCVEYARRYWIINRRLYLPSIPHAAHIWTRVTHVGSLDNPHRRVALQKLPNFGTEKPIVGDLLVYKSTPGQYVGHVAVVVDVLEKTEGLWVVHVAEQNQYNDRLWKGEHYSDELTLNISTRGNQTTYGITHKDTDLVLDGWIRPVQGQ
ncbi:hypothetical protein DYB37_002703 [Aphanomyces astaci]|uniref:Peptidase C51 domain-containing protein n=1 Tax=Aphanomyces astaci TaxID=112090 RepID=A0A3R6YUE2_APHAT|nr:hypothetical protein DYB35_002573 [Aphanomyces astaci]RHZ24656.1 hypothetical protein DYB37_002703 [Aphanomyces astaci]